MTVGFWDVVEIGKLFAIPSAPASMFIHEPRNRCDTTRARVVVKGWERNDEHERVVSSCNIRPACNILKYDGEGGWLGSVQSDRVSVLANTRLRRRTRRPH